MKMIRFGKWRSSAGRWFIWERIYWKGYRWTPFCSVRQRYKGRRKAEQHYCRDIDTEYLKTHVGEEE